MNETVCKRVFDFGKVDYCETAGRRINAVTVTVELRRRGGEDIYRYFDKNGKETFRYSPRMEKTGEKTPVYFELSVCGAIWNARKTDWINGGQCRETIDDLSKHFTKEKRELWQVINELWLNYHLNDMKAGTPEQLRAIREKFGKSNPDYDTVCEYLKSVDLYETPYTGLSVGRVWNGEKYRYGTAWLVNDLPENIVDGIISGSLFHPELKA